MAERLRLLNRRFIGLQKFGQVIITAIVRNVPVVVALRSIAADRVFRTPEFDS